LLLIDEIRYIARAMDRCVSIKATGFSNFDSNFLIFVYGTLRAGGSNEWRMSQAKFIAKLWVNTPPLAAHQKNSIAKLWVNTPPLAAHQKNSIKVNERVDPKKS
jgi:hypothetical protein